MGVSDIVHELKFLFFNAFAARTPALSLASQAMLVPQGEGAYRRFALRQFTTQGLSLGYFKFISL